MPDTGICLQRWTYDYGSLEELARNAFCAGRYKECFEACDRLNRGGKIPADMHVEMKRITDLAAGVVAGYYIAPNRELPQGYDPCEFRKKAYPGASGMINML